MRGFPVMILYVDAVNYSKIPHSEQWGLNKVLRAHSSLLVLSLEQGKNPLEKTTVRLVSWKQYNTVCRRERGTLVSWPLECSFFRVVSFGAVRVCAFYTSWKMAAFIMWLYKSLTRFKLWFFCAKLVFEECGNAYLYRYLLTAERWIKKCLGIEGSQALRESVKEKLPLSMLSLTKHVAKLLPNLTMFSMQAYFWNLFICCSG